MLNKYFLKEKFEKKIYSLLCATIHYFFPRKIDQREFSFTMDSSLKARGKAQKIKKRLVFVFMHKKDCLNTKRISF